MSEIHFIVEEAPESGFLAKALGTDIFTEADDWSQLHGRLRDAIACHFEAAERPSLIRLHHGGM